MSKPAPRPLPLFLEMVRRTAESDPEMARRALAGVRVYGDAPRAARTPRPVMASVGRASLQGGGGTSGPPVLLVPSLINPAHVLDLGPGNSLLDHLAHSGFRPYLLDWGTPGPIDRGQGLAEHITDTLLPLLRTISEPVHLIGYCLGGTMAIGAAALLPVRSLTLLATPWHFTRYSDDARGAMQSHWAANRDVIDAMGLMPVELLQSLFWNLDTARTVAKYAALADLPSDDARVATFAALEDWANSGSPITAAAATELFEGLIGRDKSGKGEWRVGGALVTPTALNAPALHFTAQNDRIAPAETAPDGITCHPCPSGHVGMVVGKGARSGLWNPLADWLRAN